jgi:hypothetical protein
MALTMNTIWILGAICLLGVAFAVMMKWRGRHDRIDLGVMNDQWISEQRLSQSADPYR